MLQMSPSAVISNRKPHTDPENLVYLSKTAAILLQGETLQIISEMSLSCNLIFDT